VKLRQHRRATLSSSAEALPQRAGNSAEIRNQRPLFRQEVVDFQQYNRQWGRVVPLQPISTTLSVWFIIGAVAAALTFLVFAQYARTETVSGYLTPVSGTAKILALRRGTISAVYVTQGQQVDAGQSLLAISTAEVNGAGDDVNATLLDTLEQQRQSLVHQIATEVQRTASERERLNAQVQKLEAEHGLLELQMTAQRQRIDGLEVLARNGARLIGRGLVSDIDQKHREDAVIQQRQGLMSLEQQQTTRDGSLSDARFTLQQLQFGQAEKIQALQSQLSSVRQRIAEVTGREAYIIRAPIAGQISLLQASVGQPADPQRISMEIVPTGSPLQAALFIPARAIGFVETGQRIKILYDAFPYERFGTYEGEITSVSRTTVTNTDVVAPVALKEPSYKATASLRVSSVDAHGKKMSLQPDMLLRANIILESHSLAHWLLAPLLKEMQG
jgi:membrane fusion protein